MQILDVLSDKSIQTSLAANEKMGLLEELTLPMAEIAQLAHRDLMDVLLERERLGSTGIGGGIGIPHGKLADLKNPLLGFGISHQGVDFDAIDQQPVHLFFILLTPSNATGTHLGLLARISRLLKDENVKEQLRQAHSPQAVRAIIAANDIDD